MTRRGHALERINLLRKQIKDLSRKTGIKPRTGRFSKEDSLRKERVRLNNIVSQRKKIKKEVKDQVLVRRLKKDKPERKKLTLKRRRDAIQRQQRELELVRRDIVEELPFQEPEEFQEPEPLQIEGGLQYSFNGQYTNTANDYESFKGDMLNLLDSDTTYDISMLGGQQIHRFPTVKVSNGRIKGLGNFLTTLIKIYNNVDSGNRSETNFSVVFTPEITNPQPIPISRDGFYNCAIAPVLFHLNTMTDNPKNQGKKNKLNKLNKKILSSGAKESDLQEVSNISQFKIVVNDKYSEWKTFTPKTKKGKEKVSKKTILLEHTNNHLKWVECKSNDEEGNKLRKVQMEEIMRRITKEGDLQRYSKEYVENPDLLNLFKDKEVEFVDDIELIEEKHFGGKIIRNKNNSILAIIDDKIYKTKFDEYEKYPKAFGDGGVGKAKFLDFHPEYSFYEPNYYDKILLESDIRSFYLRTKKSKATHHKYDMNVSYQSVDKFIKYPVIEAHFNLDCRVDTIPKKILNSHSLVFVDAYYKKAGNHVYSSDESYIDMKYIEDKNKLYYDNSGWYPIEIVKRYYKKYNINPKIKGVLYATKTFEIDDDGFTKQQFRAFVGKSYSAKCSETWRTTDIGEFLQARYKLGSKITNISITPKNGKLVYDIQYTTDRTPWAVPIIYTMILRWQKYMMFEQYNKLIDNGILPVYICVDCIEIPKRRDDLFDMGKEPGQWKKEKINLSLGSEKRLLDYYLSPNPRTNNFEPKKILMPLTHIDAGAGYGKSQFIIELFKSYPNYGYCATTHQACEELNKKAKKILGKSANATTYHKMFNINNGKGPAEFDGYFIEECSMLSVEDLMKIHHKLKNKFCSAKLFGGKRIILVGDFKQLPVINATPINKHKIYKKFDIIKLDINHRQKDDKEFGKLCDSLRGKITEKKAKSIIKKLNTRVKDLPKYDTHDDIYIAGINDQIDKINGIYDKGSVKSFVKTLKVGNKIISSETFKDQNNDKISNGAKGIIKGFNDKTITIEWDDGNISDILLKQKDNLKNGFAITIHKCQGATYERNVIIDPSRMFEKGHLYVAISRAKKMSNVYFTEPLTMDILRKSCKVI